MAKRRSIAATFQAVLEWLRAGARTMNDARPVPLHVMLFGIAANAGGTVSHLADLLGIDIKTCSRLLKNVRERGWATVEQDTKDERQRRVMLTEDGKSVVQLMHGALVDVAFRVVENVAGPQTGATFSSQQASEKRAKKKLAKT
jgi:DNA-binding MarR family transcriptional regulator